MLLVCSDFLQKGPFLKMNLHVLKAPEVFPCVVIFVQSPHLKCIDSSCFYLQYGVLWNFGKLQQSLVQEPILVMRVELKVKLVMLWRLEQLVLMLLDIAYLCKWFARSSTLQLIGALTALEVSETSETSETLEALEASDVLDLRSSSFPIYSGWCEHLGRSSSYYSCVVAFHGVDSVSEMVPDSSKVTWWLEIIHSSSF